jgi:hypothetical protein
VCLLQIEGGRCPGEVEVIMDRPIIINLANGLTAAGRMKIKEVLANRRGVAWS